MPERNAGRKAGARKEDSSALALRSKDRKNPGLANSRGGLRSHTKGTTPQVMAEKTKEETQLWNGTVLQDASVSDLVPGWRQDETDLSFLPQN